MNSAKSCYFEKELADSKIMRRRLVAQYEKRLCRRPRIVERYTSVGSNSDQQIFVVFVVCSHVHSTRLIISSQSLFS